MFSALFTTLLLAGVADFSTDFEASSGPLFFARKDEIAAGGRVKRMNPIMHCRDVTEHPFANCYKLRSIGKCSSSYSKLRDWCPRTCSFCISDRAASAPTVCKSTVFGCCADNTTAAKGPNKHGCPENCKNIRGFHCNWHAEHGFCSTHVDSMKKLCPKACKFCGKKFVNGCYNVWDDKVCSQLANAGICLVRRWKRRVAQNCARSCGICLDRSPQLKHVVPACSKEGCCWDNKTPINKGCPPCKDYFSKELCNRFKGDCNKTEQMQGVQMRTFCPDTCGICDRISCKDDLTHGVFCKEWKEKGECAKDPLGMRVFCKKTCNFC